MPRKKVAVRPLVWTTIAVPGGNRRHPMLVRSCLLCLRPACRFSMRTYARKCSVASGLTVRKTASRRRHSPELRYLPSHWEAAEPDRAHARWPNQRPRPRKASTYTGRQASSDEQLTACTPAPKTSGRAPGRSAAGPPGDGAGSPLRLSAFSPRRASRRDESARAE